MVNTIETRFWYVMPLIISLAACQRSGTELFDLRHEKVGVISVKGKPSLVQLPDGSVYKGSYKNGHFDGKGQLLWNNGDHYVGEFRQGLKQGKGKDIFASGVTYKGDFVNGYWQGKGELETASGGRYVGDFKQGQMYGKGKYTTFDGTIYKGDFKNDRMNGKGTIIYPSGARYEGEVKDWHMQGEGVYTLSKKTVVYTGHFVNDKMQGIGEIRYKDGAFYKGEIKDWQANGVGKAVSKRGTVYTGEFKDSLYDGKGLLVYRNGDRYQGSFKSGLKHGNGKYIRAKPMGRRKFFTGWWEYGSYFGKKAPKRDSHGKIIFNPPGKTAKLDAEKVFYAQADLLKASLKKIKPGRASHPEMYFLGFAGYGAQDVFMKEVRFAQHLFDTKYLTRGHSLALINNPSLAKKIPLASVTNLDIALRRVGAEMNRDQDILFMYLTSHGSPKHGLNVSLPGLPLDDLSAKRLAQMLKHSGIKWKVIAISACYSGEFVKALKDQHTIVMTSARADHVSFGCSEEADFTYFGKALLKDSLPASGSFVAAFRKARQLVTAREDKEKFGHSDPQLWTAPAIEEKLLSWRRALKRSVMLAN